jgi:hypothetical protein
MQKQVDRISRPIQVSDMVSHVRSREDAFVISLVGTHRIQVRVVKDNRIAVWYSFETMLVGRQA